MILNVVPQLPFVVNLLILLAVSRLLGELFERFNQPAMIGEVLAGCILGPSLLNVVGVSTELKTISDLGVLLLMILAGMEIEIDEIRNSIKGKAAWIAFLGFIIPMIAWFGLQLNLISNGCVKTIPFSSETISIIIGALIVLVVSFGIKGLLFEKWF